MTVTADALDMLATPAAARWSPSILRGPADADHYRIKVGRYGDRWYQDGENGPYPSITTVKKASGNDWTYVALKRVSLDNDLGSLPALEPAVRYDRLKTINDFGLKTAGGRGSIIHWWMEDMLSVGQMRTVTPAMLTAAKIPAPALVEALGYQAAIGAFFDAYQPEVIAAEMVVIHTALNGVGYGGTGDVVLRIDGDVVYVDWKSRGADSDHGAYPEEGAQIAAAARAEYMIVASATDVDRIAPPAASCGLVVSIKPDGCRLYPIDLDKGFEHFTAMHAWWVARRDERDAVGKPWPPRKVAVPAPLVAVEQPAVDPEPPTASSVVPVSAAERERLRARIGQLIDAGHMRLMRDRWPEGVETLHVQGHTDDELAQILVAVRKVEAEVGAPFHPDDSPPPRSRGAARRALAAWGDDINGAWFAASLIATFEQCRIPDCTLEGLVGQFSIEQCERLWEAAPK